MPGGTGGIQIALGGIFRKPKATLITIDQRLALAIRLDFQIPLLIIGLYLPKGSGRNIHLLSSLQSSSSSSSSSHSSLSTSSSLSSLSSSSKSRRPRVSDYATSRYDKEYRKKILRKIIKVRPILIGVKFTNTHTLSEILLAHTTWLSIRIFYRLSHRNFNAHNPSSSKS